MGTERKMGENMWIDAAGAPESLWKMDEAADTADLAAELRHFSRERLCRSLGGGFRSGN